MIIRGKLLGRAAAVAGVVLALVSTGIAQASVPQSETRSGVSGTGIKYVALGDSRASGPRLEPMYPDACSRSYENFAGKISRALEVAEFADVSCSAARAENIIDTPQLIPNYWPVQLDAVHPDTDLITISIGGNDSNSIFLGPLCVAPGPGTDRGCRYDPLANSVAQSGIDRAAGELDRILTAVTQRAPNARIYLIGEGGMISSRGCWPNIPFSDATQPGSWTISRATTRSSTRSPTPTVCAPSTLRRRASPAGTMRARVQISVGSKACSRSRRRSACTSRTPG